MATTHIADALRLGTVASPYMEDTRGNRGSYSAVRSGGPEGCSLGASYSPLPTGGSSEPTDGSVLFTRNAVCFSSESPRPGSVVAAVTRGRRRGDDSNWRELLASNGALHPVLVEHLSSQADLQNETAK